MLLPDDRAATFWQRLPDHTAGRLEDVAALLRQLHTQPPPPRTPQLTDSTGKILERLLEIEHSGILDTGDTAWLISYAQDLADASRQLPAGLPHRPLRGDAWAGNVARRHTYLLDLDSAAIGQPEWDLTSTALKTTATGTISPRQYQRFVAAYGGYDVTAGYAGYTTMRGIRELRMITYPSKPPSTAPGPSEKHATASPASVARTAPALALDRRPPPTGKDRPDSLRIVR